MQILIFLLLTCWSVKAAVLTDRKNFAVIWNVPTFHCASKKIPFTHLHDQFGIVQNRNDVFIGDKIALLYADKTGSFPARIKNSTGEYVINTGTPQTGNLDAHLEKLQSDIIKHLPYTFHGIAVIDMEAWKPIFRQNFGNQLYIKDLSYELAQDLDTTPETVEEHFESAARKFMEETLVIAKSTRPYAKWGYYGYPYCYTNAPNTEEESCSTEVVHENNRLEWLWARSDFLYPSIYSDRNLLQSQLVSLIRGRVAEAKRVAHPTTLIYPYFKITYRNSQNVFFDQDELELVIGTLYESGAAGVVVWGAYDLVNTSEKCQKLLGYVNEIFGPTVAKFTTRVVNTFAHKPKPVNATGDIIPTPTSGEGTAARNGPGMIKSDEEKKMISTTDNDKNIVPSYSNMIHLSGVNMFMLNNPFSPNGGPKPAGPGTDIKVDIKELNIHN